MKHIHYMFFLLLIYLICGARSCNDESTQMISKKSVTLADTKDSIKNAFAVDVPTDQVLRALEKTAQQKLRDFADYLKIASDSTMALNFRQQAAEMARRFFPSGKIDMQKWNPASTNVNNITLDHLLDKSISQGMPYWMQPLDIRVDMPFSWINDSTFKGNLSFNAQFFSGRNLTVQVHNSKTLAIEIYACRKRKYFGEENLRLWEVYLGDIR